MSRDKPTLAITSGEPAGIGPELMAMIDPRQFNARLVILGDETLIHQRAQMTGLAPPLQAYDTDAPAQADVVEILHVPIATPAVAGKLNVDNAHYVLQILQRACQGCLSGEFDAMVTAPIQKDIINQAGIPFSGHTEFLADLCDVEQPVMLLHTDSLRVALATTHLPLSQVPAAINSQQLTHILRILDHDLRTRFGLQRPHIKVCGLNPHAGEHGYLGREEIDIIIPVIEQLQHQGLNVSGPYPADTVFTPQSLQDADAILAMYHDQGLPVLKHVGFRNAINTTLGLPIIRTSVDHGTALTLAGTGQAHPDSLFAAINSAIEQSQQLFNSHSKQGKQG